MSTFKILSNKPTGMSRLGKPRRRWEDNIRMDLKEICINTRNSVDSAQDRHCECRFKPGFHKPCTHTHTHTYIYIYIYEFYKC